MTARAIFDQPKYSRLCEHFLLHSEPPVGMLDHNVNIPMHLFRTWNVRPDTRATPQAVLRSLCVGPLIGTLYFKKHPVPMTLRRADEPGNSKLVHRLQLDGRPGFEAALLCITLPKRLSPEPIRTSLLACMDAVQELRRFLQHARRHICLQLTRHTVKRTSNSKSEEIA